MLLLAEASAAAAGLQPAAALEVLHVLLPMAKLRLATAAVAEPRRQRQLVALLVQLLTFLALRIFIRDLPQRIARDELASGIFSASAAIAVGVLNAACMTW